MNLFDGSHFCCGYAICYMIKKYIFLYKTKGFCFVQSTWLKNLARIWYRLTLLKNFLTQNYFKGIEITSRFVIVETHEHCISSILEKWYFGALELRFPNYFLSSIPLFRLLFSKYPHVLHTSLLFPTTPHTFFIIRNHILQTYNISKQITFAFHS